MKKLFYSIMALLAITTVVSCCDEGLVQDPQETADTTKHSVTVMFYGVGGGNIDYKQIWKMRQSTSIGANDQFNMTFQYKFSSSEQDSVDFANYHGVLRMDLVDAASMKGCKDYGMHVDSLSNNLQGLPLKQYSSDASFNMSDPDNISDFIKWSVGKHPAEKYVLILANHGGGWNILNDEYFSTTTRSIIFDDNNKDSINGIAFNKSISAKTVAEGINRSGVNLEVLYLDACLMSTWEDFYEYKEAPVNYVVSSMETSYGGNYNIMINSILASPGNLKKAFDVYVKKLMKYTESRKKNSYHDIGIYDLTRINEMTPIIKEVCDTLKSQITNADDSISQNASESIRHGMLASGDIVKVPVAIGEKIKNQYNLTYIDCNFDKKNKVYKITGSYVVLFRKNHRSDWDACSESDRNTTLENIMNQDYYGISLGDILKHYSYYWSKASDKYAQQKQTASRLYKKYIDKLEDISDIACTQPLSTDQPFIETSPTVNVMALNDAGWIKWNAKTPELDQNASYFAHFFNLEKAKELYSRSTFAKETEWDEVLKVNPFNVSALNNDMRMTRYSNE